MPTEVLRGSEVQTEFGTTGRLDRLGRPVVVAAYGRITYTLSGAITTWSGAGASIVIAAP